MMKHPEAAIAHAANIARKVIGSSLGNGLDQACTLPCTPCKAPPVESFIQLFKVLAAPCQGPEAASHAERFAGYRLQSSSHSHGLVPRGMSPLGCEYVAVAILGKRADVRHQPVSTRNGELVGDRAIEDLPSRFHRHLWILID